MTEGNMTRVPVDNYECCSINKLQKRRSVSFPNIKKNPKYMFCTEFYSEYV